MEPEPLSFFSPEGHAVVWEVEAEPYVDPFERRITTVVDGTRIIERRVPRAEGRDREYLYDVLENEARMGARLLACLWRDYPVELPRLIGYSLDVEEPIVLWSDHRGEPVSRYNGSLLISEQRELQASLFGAVRIMSACGIVHRRIEPATVRWDGSAVQLTGLSHAALVGDHRIRLGEAPYASPAQREGRGRAATADDLWSAGMVIYRTVTGREVADRPDLSLAPALQPIHDVFSADPPTALEVLARLRAPDPLQGKPVESDLALEEGRAAFDQARKLKTAEEPMPQPQPQTQVLPVEPAPSPWWARWLPLVVLIVALLIWVVVGR
ncbi:hypothetical protein AB0F17_05705 [Nonomuraea sp. NPDC026600]|uniref:hypothetical protein n=1 Tax=Nonomuraea sp. NPDC026600 TaxID=3155363 RepID=UPI003400A197